CERPWGLRRQEGTTDAVPSALSARLELQALQRLQVPDLQDHLRHDHRPGARLHRGALGGPESHLKKQGTPTMGGVLILLCIVVPTLLWADLKNSFIWITLFIIVGYGVLGFVDDYKKVVEKNPKGLSPRQKMFWQVLLGVAVGTFLYNLPGFSTELYLPFFKRVHPDLGLLFIPFVTLVIVGASNAVNLTDGLDGLAIGPVTINAGTYLRFCYIAGNARLSGYLQIPYVPGAGELAVLCGALVGAGLGFLWYNSYPAEVFMGDVGSLSLGGGLGTLAVLTKQEILLVIV